MTRQRRWRLREMAKRERFYLDEPVSPVRWREMSGSQRAVWKRWKRFYARRRALREMLLGSR